MPETAAEKREGMGGAEGEGRGGGDGDGGSGEARGGKKRNAQAWLVS